MLQTKAEIGIVTSFSSNLLTTPASTQPLDWLLTSFYTAEKREYQPTSLVQYQLRKFTSTVHGSSLTSEESFPASMHNRKLNSDNNNNRKKDMARRLAHAQSYNIDDLVWLHDPTK